MKGFLLLGGVVLASCMPTAGSPDVELIPPLVITNGVDRCGYMVCNGDPLPLPAEHPACLWSPPEGEGRYAPNPHIDPAIPYTGQYGVCP